MINLKRKTTNDCINNEEQSTEEQLLSTRISFKKKKLDEDDDCIKSKNLEEINLSNQLLISFNDDNKIDLFSSSKLNNELNETNCISVSEELNITDIKSITNDNLNKSVDSEGFLIQEDLDDLDDHSISSQDNPNIIDVTDYDNFPELSESILKSNSKKNRKKEIENNGKDDEDNELDNYSNDNANNDKEYNSDDDTNNDKECNLDVNSNNDKEYNSDDNNKSNHTNNSTDSTSIKQHLSSKLSIDKEHKSLEEIRNKIEKNLIDILENNSDNITADSEISVCIKIKEKSKDKIVKSRKIKYQLIDEKDLIFNEL